jgi:hypothetical protein
LGPVKERGGSGIVIDPLGGRGHFRHEFVKEKPPSPVGQNHLDLGNPEEKVVERLEGFQALSPVFMSHRFIDMEEKGGLGCSQRFQQRRKTFDVLESDPSPVKSQFTDSLGPQG